MKKLLFLILFSILSLFSFAEERIIDSTLSVGDGSAQDVTIKADIGSGGSNPFLKLDNASGKWQFQNVGSTPKNLGSGSGSGGSGGINVLINEGTEDGLEGYTSSGGSLSSQLFVNPTSSDERFIRFVSTVSGEYFQQLITSWPEKIGEGCMADFKYIQGDSAFTYKVIEDPSGTPKELASGSVADLTSWQKAPTIKMNCPTTGAQVVLRIESTGAGTIDVDDLYLGSNKGFLSGGYTNTCKLEGSDARVITATTESIYWSGSCDGWVSGVDGSGPAAGNYYQVQREGSRIKINGRVSDGSAAGADISIYVDGSFYKKVHRTRSTYQTGGKPVLYDGIKNEFPKDSKIAFILSNGLTLNTDIAEHYLNIEEVSDQSQEAWNPEQANFSIDVSIGGGNPAPGAASTPTSIGHPSLDMVLNKGSAKITCANGTPSTSLTCSGADERIGLTFDAPVQGKYRICLSALSFNNGTGSAFRFAQTQSSSDETIVQQGTAIAGNPNATDSVSIYLCDEFQFEKGEVTLKLFYESNGVVTIYGDRLATAYDRDINIKVDLAGNSVDRPVIQDMVSTSNAIGITSEGCRVNNNGTATFDSGSQMCSGWIDTATRTVLGTVDMTVSGFSSNPVCSCSTRVNANCSVNVQSPTQVIVLTATDTTANDWDYEILCSGRR